MIDLACAYGLVAAVVVAGLAYFARSVIRGRAHADRIAKAGSSVLLGADALEGAYWALGPVGRLLAKLGVSPNSITLTSLALGFVAAGFLIAGHHGIAAVLLAISSLGDALDGFVARARNIASDAGEVVDAIADRYQELVVLSALLIVYRENNLGLAASLAAIAGSLMISYTTAKAEAMLVPPPRGYMRRAERAVWLNVAIALTPIAVSLAARGSIPAWGAFVPEIGALLAIGVIANISSVIRTAKIVAALRAKQPPAAPESLSAHASTPHAEAVAPATDAVDNTTTFHEEPAR